MKSWIAFTFLIISFHSFGFMGDGTYEVSTGSVTYNIKYLLKDIQGTSSLVKGLAKCNSNTCDVIIAVPVKSFKSKDTNRDMNMLTYTKAAKHPMIKVKIKTPKVITMKTKFDAIINFAGVERIYKGLLINSLNKKSSSIHIRNSISLKLSDFKVERPSLLGVAIDDLVPVDIELLWKKKD